MEAVELVHGDSEIAFLDLREIGPYSEGHPLFASPLPFSRLEMGIAGMVPRPDVQLLLIDGGDGIAKIGSGYLEEMGYSRVAIIRGGIPAWAECGQNLFKGVHVPSKTLGELAERRWRPAMLDPVSLRERLASDECPDLIDCRPATEFRKFTIPGARNMPTGEIVHRFLSLDGRPVVLTCAGRTRSIIGTIGLMLIAPDRECLALENGTQGWTIAGMALDSGCQAGPMPEQGEAEMAGIRRHSDAFMARHEIPCIGTGSVRGLLNDCARTTYCLDVRPEETAVVDPLPAFRNISSGQLLQVTDTIMGVRRARVVLADDLGMRAALAGFWLRSLGFEPYVTRVDDGLRGIPAMPDDLPGLSPSDFIDAGSVLDEFAGGTAGILDLRKSAAFMAGHVKGSIWCTRARLADITRERKWCIVADSDQMAGLGARELERLGHAGFAVVNGGFDSLRTRGAKIESGHESGVSELVDIPSFAHGRHEGNRDASRQYLEWETGLVGQLSSRERSEFHL